MIAEGSSTPLAGDIAEECAIQHACVTTCHKRTPARTTCERRVGLIIPLVLA